MRMSVKSQFRISLN